MDARSPAAALDAVSLAAAVRGRASVRRYLPDPVPHEDVTAMVDLAVRAANAGNAQMWRFIAVEDELTQVAMRQAVDDAIDAMAAWPELAGKEKEIKALRVYATFFVEAPLSIAVFGLPYVSRADEMLAARGVGPEERDRLAPAAGPAEHRGGRPAAVHGRPRLGYGTCWMTAPVLGAARIEQLLGVEPPARLVALVPVGRPAGEVRPSSRRPVEDVLEFR